MAINIPSAPIENAITAKINAKIESITPTTPLLEIRSIEKYASDLGSEAIYDSVGALPESTDTNIGTTYVSRESGQDGYSGNNLYVSIGGINFALQAIESPAPFTTTYSGWTAGGLIHTDAINDNYPPYNVTSAIKQHRFDVDLVLNDVGNLTSNRFTTVAFSSTTHGYTGIGKTYSSNLHPIAGPSGVFVFEKFAFTNGNVSVSLGGSMPSWAPTSTNNGSSIHSWSHGYHAFGGRWGDNPNPATQPNAQIKKYAFVNDVVTSIGNALSPEYSQASTSHTYDAGYGYITGGQTAPSGPPASILYPSTISRFSYVSDVSDGNVGNLTAARRNAASTSSETDGYAIFGSSTPGTDYPVNQNAEKFPFATSVSVSLVPTSIGTHERSHTYNSKTKAYVVGGIGFAPVIPSTPTYHLVGDVVQKMDYSNDNWSVLTSVITDATAPGVPSVGISGSGGMQS